MFFLNRALGSQRRTYKAKLVTRLAQETDAVSLWPAEQRGLLMRLVTCARLCAQRGWLSASVAPYSCGPTR